MAQTGVEPARAQQEFTGGDFRSAVGAFATGVTVITTHGEADVYGMTANAFSSVSLDPPLVLICVISGTTGAETIARYFSSRERPGGRAAFREVPHFTAVTGSPILQRAAAYLDCSVSAEHEA